jgi:hypothetical protein
MSDPIDDLRQKEEWAQSVAPTLLIDGRLTLEEALAVARWASLWMDDFTGRMTKLAPCSEEVVLDALRESWSDSFARAEGVPRYPSGAPTLRACTSVNHAFCLAANDQFDEYWELVEKM